MARGSGWGNNLKNKTQNITVCVCVYQSSSFETDKEKPKSPSEPMLQGENPSEDRVKT